MSNQLFYAAVLRGNLPIFADAAREGWPQRLYPWFLATAQLPDADTPDRRAFMLHMVDCIRSGTLAAQAQPIAWDDHALIEPHIAPADFAAWLQREGIEPSPLIREWLAHYGAAPTKTAPAPQPAPQPAPAPTRKKADAWFEATRDYLVNVTRAEGFATAQRLTRYLHNIAGDNTPFRSSNQVGKLFVDSVGKPIADSTIEKKWGEIRALANRPTPD